MSANHLQLFSLTTNDSTAIENREGSQWTVDRDLLRTVAGV